MYHSNTDYEQENKSNDNNKIYLMDKEFQPPAGILYENMKANDSEEYDTDDDSVPPLETIPDYDSYDF